MLVAALMMAVADCLFDWWEWFESSLITLLLHTETLREEARVDIDCVIGGIILLFIRFDEEPMLELELLT